MFENLEHDFGVGDGKATACVNSLAYLIYAEQKGISREDALANLTDMVDCICPVVRRLSIRINDRKPYWPDHAEATKWMHETAPRLLGTKASIEMVRKREFLCADSAIREIAPVWFDLAAEKWPEAKEWAGKLRACELVTDTRTARAAQKIAQEAKRVAVAAAAAYADAAADADAYAYAAAYADAAADAYAYAYADADAAADAAADADAAAYAAAYAYAAAAAYADAYADAAADAAKIIKPIMLSLLNRLIECRE